MNASDKYFHLVQLKTNLESELTTLKSQEDTIIWKRWNEMYDQVKEFSEEPATKEHLTELFLQGKDEYQYLLDELTLKLESCNRLIQHYSDLLTLDLPDWD